jgi:hypothetical protein
LPRLNRHAAVAGCGTLRLNSPPIRRDGEPVKQALALSVGIAQTVSQCSKSLDNGPAATEDLPELEAAQDMANHSDPRTTKLHDRRKDLATLSEIERRIAL